MAAMEICLILGIIIRTVWEAQAAKAASTALSFWNDHFQATYLTKQKNKKSDFQ